MHLVNSPWPSSRPERKQTRKWVPPWKGRLTQTSEWSEAHPTMQGGAPLEALLWSQDLEVGFQSRVWQLVTRLLARRTHSPWWARCGISQHVPRHNAAFSTPALFFFFFTAKPQDVPLLCGSALLSSTTSQSMLIMLWPGIQFVPVILCGGLWAELIWSGKSSGRREINYCSLSKAHNRARWVGCTRLPSRY